MTRIAGTNLIKAPCCGAFFSTVAFASINFMASEHWTDGQDENSLSQSDGGLRRCTCGGYFLSCYRRLLCSYPNIPNTSCIFVRIQLAKVVIVEVAELSCSWMPDTRRKVEIGYS
jgi:hypothetical protein